MICKQTKLKIVDNSGAKLIRIFQLIGYSQSYSRTGDLVLGSVIKYRANKKIQKKQLCRVLVVTTKKNLHRSNGSAIRFDENRGVVISELSKIVGTRIFGPISKELKSSKYSRLLSLVKKSV